MEAEGRVYQLRGGPFDGCRTITITPKPDGWLVCRLVPGQGPTSYEAYRLVEGAAPPAAEWKFQVLPSMCSADRLTFEARERIAPVIRPRELLPEPLDAPPIWPPGWLKPG